MRPIRTILAIAVFLVAALAALGGATLAVNAIESTGKRLIGERFAEAGIDWAEIDTDGLLVTLSGTAGSEAVRFRALSIAATVVDASRVIDAMEVADPAAIAPPRFSMELLRNDDGVSMIGLVPAAFGNEGIRERVARATAGAEVADMLELADHPVPAGWAVAVDYGLAALAMLPRSKISIAADRVAVTALTDSREEQRRVETQLARSRPEGLLVALEIAAPRPVITPYTLRFVIDERGARFDACSADTEAARTAILAAGVAAGVQGQISCTIGLGVPSPRWHEAATAAIAVLASLGQGTVTFSDADVSLIVPHQVPADAYDAAVGRLGAALPDVFSLDATRLPEPVAENASAAPAEFVATLSDEGRVLLRGRLADAQLRDAVLSLARARFGSGVVEAATRIDPDVPEGWARRVLAGIEVLAELHEGTVTVRERSVEVTGRSGNPEVTDALARVLADKLGRGQVFRIDVVYDERLDPVAMAPTPERCIADIGEILAGRKITFAPGSARIDAEANAGLDAIAAVLRECGEFPLEIAGHTDSQGRAEMNLALSQRRAEAVRDALASRRVLVSAITAQGYGQENPIADNATAAGREANRRIEFRLLGGDEEAQAVSAAVPGRDPEAEAALEIPVIIVEEGSTRPEPRPASPEE